MELAVVVLVFLLLFGATKIPELARSLGEAKRAFQEGLSEVSRHDPDEPPETDEPS